MTKGGVLRPLTLAEGLSAVTGFWERKTQFFFKGVALDMSTMLQWMPSPTHEYVDTTDSSQ